MCTVSNGKVGGFSVLWVSMHFESRKEVFLIEFVSIPLHFSFTGGTVRGRDLLKVFSPNLLP